MYQSKFNHGLMPRTIGGIFEDIFNNGFQKIAGEDVTNSFSAPVNIQETETAYTLHVFAPGLKKEDFKITNDKNTLHISYDKKEESNESNGKWLRKEFKRRSFSRSFTLSEKINQGGISASYNNGVLIITLPKKEAAETTVQEISVN